MGIQKYSTKQIEVFLETFGYPKDQLVAFFKKEHGMIVTASIIGHQRSQINNWIYMLKDVMTAEEAFKDYCIETAKFSNVPWKKNPKWLEWVKKNAHLSVKELMYRFFTKFTDKEGNHIKVSTNAMTMQRQTLGKNKIISTSNKYKVREKDIHPELYLDPNFEVKNCLEPIHVICYEYGHKIIKNGISHLYDRGCSLCKAVGQMSLTELKNHPLGQQPTYIYGVQFADLVGKTGHCGKHIGIKERGKKWPPFEVKRKELTTLYHARRIESATQNEVNRIPLYEPLKGNGGTECFEEHNFYKALEVLDREIKCLK